jgi:hypothetical protein
MKFFVGVLYQKLSRLRGRLYLSVLSVLHDIWVKFGIGDLHIIAVDQL